MKDGKVALLVAPQLLLMHSRIKLPFNRMLMLISVELLSSTIDGLDQLLTAPLEEPLLIPESVLVQTIVHLEDNYSKPRLSETMAHTIPTHLPMISPLSKLVVPLQ